MIKSHFKIWNNKFDLVKLNDITGISRVYVRKERQLQKKLKIQKAYLGGRRDNVMATCYRT